MMTKEEGTLLKLTRHNLLNLSSLFINHCPGSSDVHIKVRDNGSNFVALHETGHDKELSWDYESTKFELSPPFDCTCGSSLCHGKLCSRFCYHKEEILQSNDLEYIIPYLLEWLHDLKPLEQKEETIFCDLSASCKDKVEIRSKPGFVQCESFSWISRSVVDTLITLSVIMILLNWEGYKCLQILPVHTTCKNPNLGQLGFGEGVVA